MTREEALISLEEIFDVYDEIHETSDGDDGYKEMTALRMAIEALQSTMSQERVNHESTNDLISRADAIEAVRKELVCDGRHDIHDKVCRFIADVLLPALPSAKGGDAEMNEAKSPYMQQSPNNGADLSAEAVQGFRGGKIPPKEMLDGTVLIPKHQWIKMERELANLKQEFESADAVQVVRCKDCKASRVYGKTTQWLACEDVMEGQATDPDGYCYLGERREP